MRVIADAVENRVESVLSTQGWRVLSALLDDVSWDADPILEPAEMLDCEEYVTVCYELHHVILPELEDEGLVEFNRCDDLVRRGPDFDVVRPFLG